MTKLMGITQKEVTNLGSFLSALQLLYVMQCTIWYHLYNLKTNKSTHGGELLLVELQKIAQSISYMEIWLSLNPR